MSETAHWKVSLTGAASAYGGMWHLFWGHRGHECEPIPRPTRGGDDVVSSAEPLESPGIEALADVFREWSEASSKAAGGLDPWVECVAADQCDDLDATLVSLKQRIETGETGVLSQLRDAALDSLADPVDVDQRCIITEFLASVWTVDAQATAVEAIRTALQSELEDLKYAGISAAGLLVRGLRPGFRNAIREMANETKEGTDLHRAALAFLGSSPRHRDR